MIISDNLRTASIYINNQLLSRGLLRDGDTIDFAYPGDNDDELANTMGRIMGVVNDLILRRDVRFPSFSLPLPSLPYPQTNTYAPLSNSATPKPANRSPKPSAPCAPSPCARPPTSSGSPTSSPTRPAKPRSPSKKPCTRAPSSKPLSRPFTN